MNSRVPEQTEGAFPREARLLKHSDFDRVYQQGRKHFSSNMTVFYLRREELLQTGRPGAAVPTQAETEPDPSLRARASAGARVGFTVGRVLGGAVERNRIKRRLREAVRLRRSVLPANVDVVINPKKSVLTLEFSTVLEEVGRALEAVAKKVVIGR